MTASTHPALAGLDRALVVGLGTSGRSAARALLDAGMKVTAVDEQDEVTELDGLDAAEIHLHADPARHLDGVDLVVPSPGVPEHAAVLVAAEARDLPIWSEPELGWRLQPRRLVGITGTNGKTSVTELTAAMLTEGGFDAHACGNIGTTLTDAAAAAAPDSVLVAELSSFQLRFCHNLRPEVGVLLNLAPDHLDWHGDLDGYERAKTRLWQAQAASDWAVAGDDHRARTLAEAHAPGQVARAFASRPAEGPGVGLEDGVLVSRVPARRGELLKLDELPVRAPHHVGNVAAAATAALLAGASLEAAGRAAREFHPGHHRLETVAETGGVRWVDDSKATNPHAAAAALAACEDRPIVWIAGGIAKGVDLTALDDSLGAVRHAVLIGESAEQLAAVCERADVPVTRARDMVEAVRVAARAADEGDVVLLAPACASFDMFDDYADRGEQFAAAVRGLEGTDG